MKFGNVNLGGLKKLQQKLNAVTQADMDAFLTACAKELAARLLRDVIRNTPVGQYPKGSGKTGGTLRRGWTAKTHEEAAGGHGSGLSNVEDFLNGITITHEGNVYRLEIINPVEYAPHVEYGHRTPDHKGWVQGRFMLTLAESHIQQISEKLLAQRLKTFLEGYFKP